MTDRQRRFRSVLVMITLILIIFLAFVVFYPMAFHKMIVESLEQTVAERVEEGHENYIATEKENARKEVERFLGSIEDVDDSQLFRDLSEEERQTYILEWLETERFGHRNTGFFFVVNSQGRLLSGSENERTGWETVDGRLDLEDGDLFSRLVKEKADRGGGYIETTVLNSRGYREKLISYVQYSRKWPWIVGAGFPGSLPADLSRNQLDTWRKTTAPLIEYMERRIVIFISAVFIVAVLTMLVFFRLLKKNIDIDRELTRYHAAMDESLCVMVTDIHGIITRVNRNYADLCGTEESEMVGKPFYYNYHPDVDEYQQESVRSAMRKGENWRGIIKCITSGGAPVRFQGMIGPVTDDKNEVTGYLAVAQDVTELHRSRKELEKASVVDPLTGYGNRFKLLKDLDTYSGSLVACFNIDNFSNINRLFGLSGGDELLNHVAECLVRTLDREKEMFYRLSGDTFVIRGGGEDPELFIGRNIKRQNQLNPISMENGSLPYSVSLRMGIATCEPDPLLMADSALNAAKNDSRGYRIVRDCREERELMGMNQIKQLSIIKSALAENRLSLFFQPIAHIGTGSIDKYECLLRVHDEKGGILSPAELIEVAKKGRLYKQITFFVIDGVVKACRRSDKVFSINLTLEDFLDEETVAYLIERTAENNAARRIILEIVETEELEEYENLESIFTELKALGFRIAIDDFGSGFSNFTYLLKLNIDFLKIDGSLIRNILNDDKSQSLVASIILFAEESGFQTIAEYIENPEILEKVRELGIDYAQGYHIGKPDRLIRE